MACAFAAAPFVRPPPKRARVALSPVMAPPARSALLHRRVVRCSSSSDATVEESKREQEAELQPLSRRLRALLTVLSSAGALETGYLTFAKLFQTTGKICATQGCLDVLTGPFSAIFGIPLSLVGCAMYMAVAFLSAWPLFARAEEQFVDVDAGTTTTVSASAVYARRDYATRPLLLGATAMMLVSSAYLMGVLMLVIGDICPYCIFSAALSLILFSLTTISRAVPRATSALRIIIASSTVAASISAAHFALAAPNARAPDSPQEPPVVSTTSSRDALRIGRILHEKHTRMYGAYWCTHCFDQKQRLGKRAFSLIDYVECDPHGARTQFKMCREKRIPGYPTWEIDGELYPGEIALEDLEKIASD